MSESNSYNGPALVAQRIVRGVPAQPIDRSVKYHDRGSDYNDQ